MSNEETVKSMYAAFGRGDIPTILEGLSDDVAWRIHVTLPEGFPYPEKAIGPAAVGAWFQGLGGSTDFLAFEPRWFVSSGDRVVSGGSWDARSKATGGRVASEWVHCWRFDADGKVLSFDDFLDGTALVAAHQPVAVPA